MSRVKAIVPVGQFIKEVMKDKNVKGVELSDKTGISTSLISQFRAEAVNPWFEKIETLLNSMGEELVILDSYGELVNLPNTVNTPTQLYNKIGVFYFKLKNGDIYGITTISKKSKDEFTL